MSDNSTTHQETLRKLASLNTPALADAAGSQGVIPPGLSRFCGTGTVAGRAITADCTEGSLAAIWATLDHAQPGDILCVIAPGSTAYMGDLLATDIVNRGVIAVIMDGYFRDRDTISQMLLSVFARGVTPAVRRGREPGRSMTPVSIGGIMINPGDWVVLDNDGIIVIPPQDVEAVLAKAEEHAKFEERVMARLKAGARIMDAVKAETGS